MAKFKMQESEESLRLIEKAKEVEERIASKHSMNYTSLQELQKQIEEAIGKKEDQPQKKAVPKKEGLLQKLAPNTPFKIAAYVGLIGKYIIFISFIRS